MGYWPAAAGLLGFSWLKLVAPDRTTLPVLRVAAALFALVSVVGSLTMGEREESFVLTDLPHGRSSRSQRSRDARQLSAKSPAGR
ncbi:hypothetical protein [Lapillicoccus sp.]|uniref:hypothetical protein n=1 Tax=Lapillicoccus sp. TaxID=1909287 RepID=UPI003262E045